MKSFFLKRGLITVIFLAWITGVQAITPISACDSIGDSLVHNNTGIADSILQFAMTYIGTPYQYGSTSSRTFDCSGFVCHCYGKFGIELPHGSSAQAMKGERVKQEDVQPGDLLFFNGRKAGGKSIGHVSIVMSNENGVVRMIHATHRGVVIDEYPDSGYYQKRYVKACRIIGG